MKQSKKCIIGAIILVLIGIIYALFPKDLVGGAKFFGLNLITDSGKIKEMLQLYNNMFRIIIIIISIFLCVNAMIFSKEYKKEMGKSPNGYGIIILGTIMNIIGIYFGNVFVGIGVLFTLLNPKK